MNNIFLTKNLIIIFIFLLFFTFNERIYDGKRTYIFNEITNETILFHE